MTEEEIKNIKLLNPRFEVKIDYPSSDYEVGQIVHVVDGFSWNDDGDAIASLNFYEAYPEIFKPLNWWDKRDTNELPKYVKSGKLIDQPRWISKEDPRHKMGLICTVSLQPVNGQGLLPATEEEYYKSKR